MRPLPLLLLLLTLASCDLLGGEDGDDLPEGHLVFSVLDTTVQRTLLYAIDLDGSHLTPLSFLTDSTFNPDGKPTPRGGGYRPRWSPDGARIAYEEVQGPDESHIVVMDADGGGKRNLTYVGGYAINPEWGPGGRWVMYNKGSWGLIFGLYLKGLGDATDVCITCIEDESPLTFEGRQIAVMDAVRNGEDDLLNVVGLFADELVPSPYDPGYDPEVPLPAAALYQVRISTRQVERRLAEGLPPGNAYFLAPDARSLLFVGDLFDEAKRTLYLASVAGEAEPVPLLRGRVLQEASEVTWASDSRHVTYIQQSGPYGHGSGDVFILDAEYPERSPQRVPIPFEGISSADLFIPTQPD